MHPLLNLNEICEKVRDMNILDLYQYFSARVTIDCFDTDISKVVYEACPLDTCKKKVFPEAIIDPELGIKELFYCEKCDEKYELFKHRYMLKAYLVDESNPQGFRVTMFNETAEQLLGLSASELVQLRKKDENEYYSCMNNPLQKTLTVVIRAALTAWEETGKISLNGIVDEIKDLNKVQESAPTQYSEKGLSQENKEAE